MRGYVFIIDMRESDLVLCYLGVKTKVTEYVTVIAFERLVLLTFSFIEEMCTSILF